MQTLLELCHKSGEAIFTRARRMEHNHPPVWDCTDEIPRTGSWGTVLYGMALLLALPVYALVVIVIDRFYAEPGVMATYLEVLHSPVTWMLIMVGTLLAGSVLYWLRGEPEGMGFCFDEHQQRFTFTQRRPARAPTAGCVPYSDIYAISPYKMTAFGPISHIEVSFKDANGKRVFLTFWMHVSEKDMAFHAVWLRASFGERMHEVMDLDK